MNICDHSNYSDYFERCEDCNATREQIIELEVSGGKHYLAAYADDLGQYLHSGRNTRTLAELKDHLLGYAAADTEVDDQEQLSKLDAFGVADALGLTVYHQPEPFEED